MLHTTIIVTTITTTFIIIATNIIYRYTPLWLLFYYRNYLLLRLQSYCYNITSFKKGHGVDKEKKNRLWAHTYVRLYWSNYNFHYSSNIKTRKEKTRRQQTKRTRVERNIYVHMYISKVYFDKSRRDYSRYSVDVTCNCLSPRYIRSSRYRYCGMRNNVFFFFFSYI